MNVIKIIINEKEYVVSGKEDEEYIQKVAFYVDKKIKYIKNQANEFIDTQSVSVLTCLNIADEYFKERDRATKQRGINAELEQKIDVLNQKIASVESTNENLKKELTQKEIEFNQLSTM